MSENPIPAASHGVQGKYYPAIMGIVDRWQQALRDLDMGPDGLFRAELHCLRCNKRLNADGGHPAEVHAGTSNGLCYACTAAGPYVARVFVLDGAREVSWPPHCPSWRRDREKHYAYPDCPECKGLGATGPHSWGAAAKYCQPCFGRFFGHPARQVNSEWGTKILEAGLRAFETRLKQALGLPPRCSYKRYQAALETLTPEMRKPIQVDVLSRVNRLRALNTRRADRTQAWAWRGPTPEEVTP